MIELVENNTNKTVLSTRERYHALFDDIDDIDPFDTKKEELAANLSGLLSYSGLSRSQLSVKSGWKKSRITNILNGRGNLTFKTLCEFSRTLGYEADLIFRKQNESRARQPWQKITEISHNLYSVTSVFPLVVKTADEVKDDFIKNNNQTHYVTCSSRYILPTSSLQHMPSCSMPNIKITTTACLSEG